ERREPRREEEKRDDLGAGQRKKSSGVGPQKEASDAPVFTELSDAEKDLMSHMEQGWRLETDSLSGGGWSGSGDARFEGEYQSRCSTKVEQRLPPFTDKAHLGEEFSPEALLERNFATHSLDWKQWCCLCSSAMICQKEAITNKIDLLQWQEEDLC